ncbi:PREDICTED: glutamyl aminopeptidase-like isoform X2 [Nicrophorus vespilloides]|uniref:Aminopeptidase n=1 Tax=Nicrophorus vespilloides TaxID=110193 RepID=A0ABM1NGF0_NICVS|nr:PREDICTED: glutamyl aminopeptidase-like isoform X2 [Nicrophorus vespilloides]
MNFFRFAKRAFKAHSGCLLLPKQRPDAFRNRRFVSSVLQKPIAGNKANLLALQNLNLRDDLYDCEELHLQTEQIPATPTSTMDVRKFRLPEGVKPTTYDLTLKPRLTEGIFDGTVKITVDVKQSVPDIRLHSNGLSIKSVKVNSEEVKFHLEPEYELLIVEKPSEMNAKVEMSIEFSGSMLDRIVGLYSSTYKSGGKSRSIATTKFEPTYARQAFPCFDEPNMKANFTVHLLKPKESEYIALSNMPEDGDPVDVEDGVMVHFKESVKMSTYLACFIVSDFKSTNDEIMSSHGNIPFRVFATPAQLEKTNYARVTGKKIMEFYLDYFNIKYPLPKLDMVAIPDFVSGAMEHWGLVTYRETALLFDKNISSSNNQQRVATVVAHELAHSWFGNLVTMNWWNDLWLNEGFASYIEYKGVNAAEPDWGMMDQFIVDDLHAVLKLDATMASHPIVQTVETPDQITEIFDTISYNKGASVLRMLENAVTESIFQKGVTMYLNKHAYGNAVTQDLLNELQSLSEDGVDITEFMNTWTVQKGYPIVTVSKTQTGFRLTQKRFLADPDKDDSASGNVAYGYKWTIPITYITDKNNESKLVWFKHTDSHVDIDAGDADWVKFNDHQVGYYRVNYEDEDWMKLIKNIRNLDVSNRAHLFEETFSIAESGQLPYRIPLDLTKSLVEERDYVPWVAASNALDKIKDYLISSDVYSNYKTYIINTVSKAYEHFTWVEKPDEGHLFKRARVVVLDLACTMGHADCLKEAKKHFDDWLQGTINFSQDLRGLVYSFGMESASAEEWEKVWEKFVNEIDAGEKIRLMNGLASTKEPTLLIKLIELAKDDTYIRKQDYFSLLSSISSNPLGTSIVWDYVRENWLVLVNRFGLNDRYLGRLIPSITQRFSSTVKMEEMEAFFAKYPNAGAGESARKQALETVSNNIKWLEENKKSVEDWIKAN